ncbi:uncharacterized protein LOC107266920 [Cephus cinctus]|uniref:Uncharacterized protein LOC107266920 n=1 Tax=Cephus cinctus TaxID=211228 RepID=A0AAJ7BSU0_CEPCN|nr:uncharacterized protein LOC107266920 [Cephus cinctus]
MTRKCIVSGCRSGYVSNKNKVSLFHVPKDIELRNQWLRALPKGNIPITTSHLVCEKHFAACDIVRENVHKDATGKIILQVSLKHPRLNDTAVPSIFSSPRQHCKINNDNNIENVTESKVIYQESSLYTVKTDKVYQNIVYRDHDYAHSMDLEWEGDVENTKAYGKTCKNNVIEDCTGNVEDEPSDDRTMLTLKDCYSELLNNENLIEIPKGWFRYKDNEGKKWVAFSTFGVQNQGNNLQPLIRKSVLVLEDGTVHMSAHGKTLSSKNISLLPKPVETTSELCHLLKTLSNMNICTGVAMLQGAQSVPSNVGCQDSFGDWRHKDCPVLCIKRVCTRCQRLKKTLQERNRRLIKQNKKLGRLKLVCRTERDREKFVVLRKKIRSEAAVARRASEKIKKIQGIISKAQMTIKNLREQSIKDKCEKLKLPEPQQLAIQEIIAAAGKDNKKGNRYSENWVMMSMLMFIRSPAYYRFLRENDVLPLPSPHTVRRYLSIMNVKCGVDSNFLELFKKNLTSKTPIQRHGILLVDEISLR